MNLKQQYREKIRAAKNWIMAEFEQEALKIVRDFPEVPYSKLAPSLGISTTELCLIASRNGLARRRGQGSPSWKKRFTSKKQKTDY